MYQIKNIKKLTVTPHPAVGHTYLLTLDGQVGKKLSIKLTDDELISVFGFYVNVQSYVGRCLTQSDVESLI